MTVYMVDSLAMTIYINTTDPRINRIAYNNYINFREVKDQFLSYFKCSR